MTNVEQISPLRRAVGYSAGSIIAAVTSLAAFSAVYDWGHAGTLWASAAGFVGGCIPNYILNRRWAWPDRRRQDRVREAASYVLLSLASFLVAAVTTHYAELLARHLTDDQGWREILVDAAFLASSGVFFVIKFVLYHYLVFTGPRGEHAPGREPARPGAKVRSRSGRSAAPSPALPTTSSRLPGRTGTRT